MRRSSFLKSIRLIAAILCGMVVFAVLFSAVFIAMEADHDCSGENCPVCACLQLCEQFLHRTLGMAAGAPVLAASALLLSAGAAGVFSGLQRVHMLRAVRLLC